MIRVCPKCNKVFHYRKDVVPVSCPHCAYSFVTKRIYEREEKAFECIYIYEGGKQTALTMNISDGGACINYNGEPIPKNTVLDFYIQGLNIHRPAKLVWSKSAGSQRSVSGIRYIES